MSQPDVHGPASAPPPSTPSDLVPRKRILTPTVLGWAFWDWGSASFNAVATTFVFSVYLTSGLFADKVTSTEHLTTGLTIAGVLIAVLAPVTGQRADRRGRGGVWLGWFTAAVVACMALMFFVAPDGAWGGTRALWLGIVLLGLGNVFFEFASVNYNAMLNHISDRSTMGRISGLGWGMGYVGGIVLLLFLFVAFINPEVGLFGVTGDNGLNIRVSMLFAAAWFAVFATPVILNPPRPRHRGEDSGREPLWASYRRLWGTVVSLSRNAPHTLAFLIASAVFRDGLAGVFTFGAILAGTVFGFTASEVIVFAIAANIVAGLATIGFGALDDRIGPKRVIVLSLVVMVATGTGVFLLHSHGKVVFWSLGLLLCVFVGPAQSASRSFLGRVIPPGREGEVFGLYATTGRAVSFLSPLLYGLSVRLGRHLTPEGQDPTHWGILGIVVILLVGLVLVLPIREDRTHLDIYEGDAPGSSRVR